MYKVTFTNKTIFLGNSFDGSWNKMPEKLIITKMEYMFGKRKLVMEGFEAYHHSYTQYILSGRVKKITGLYLMGKIGNKVEVFYYDIRLKKPFKYFALWGEELKSPVYKNNSIVGWQQDQPAGGWRDGIKCDSPKMLIEKN